MALKLNFREVTPEDTEILRMIALRNGKAEDYLCCDVTNEDGVTQTTWYILLENVPGLAPTSLLLLEQLRTIDRKRLRGYIGRISKEKMLEVDAALAISIGIGYPNERRTHNV